MPGGFSSPEAGSPALRSRSKSPAIRFQECQRGACFPDIIASIRGGHMSAIKIM